jgi:hypothetical protein
MGAGAALFAAGALVAIVIAGIVTVAAAVTDWCAP